MSQDDSADKLFFIVFALCAGVFLFACMCYALIGLGMII